MKSSLRSLKSSRKRKAPSDISGTPLTKQSKKPFINMTKSATENADVDCSDDYKIFNLSPETVVLATPIKSESDRKEYRQIRLSNGLRALLIDSTHAVRVSTVKDADDTTSEENDEESESDEESGDEDVEYESIANSEEENESMAACSLMVDVGSFSDPPHIQGLAHFLEHLIFMGSKKYPEENEFDSFINRCGGSDNADTDCEETSFYFEVTENSLDGALDRFSQLFISPLLCRDAMDREREAVDSEFQTKINQDGTRREQLLASIVNDNHPASLFTWGNLVTLKEQVSDDELYSAVHEFRKRHYSSHRMFVCIQARRCLDELQALVENYFLDIENNQLPGDDMARFNDTNVFRDSFFEQVYYVRAKQEINKLDITWVLPSITKLYKTKPDEFVSFIVGHEGTGSLCSYLRKQLLALDVHAGTDFSGFENNSMYALFTISISLTEKGLEKLDQVIEAVFALLHTLAESPIDRELFDELKQIENNSFKFQTEKEAIENVEDYVVNLKYYQPEHVLGGSSLFYEYDESQFKTMISHLNSRRFNIMLTTVKPYKNVIYNGKEKWFGTEYGVSDYPEKWLQLWQKRTTGLPLHLPLRNEFVATNFHVHHSHVTEDQTSDTDIASRHPVNLVKTDHLELWHRPDDLFLLPHAHCYFYLMNNVPQQSLRDMTLLNLMSNVIKYYLAESLYPATVCGLSYQLYSSELGLVLKVSGFNEKLHLIVEKVTEVLNTLKDITESNVVEVMRRQMLRNYHNAFIRSKGLCKELRLSVLQNVYWPMYEKHTIAKELTDEELKAFIKKFFTHLKVKALIQGNITNDAAIKITEKLVATLGAQPLTTPIKQCTKELPIGEWFLRVKSFRQNDVNTSITNYYQVGPSSITKTAYLDLLDSLIEEPLFDTLRTKEQLGYEVSSDVKDTLGILGFTVTVHSQENKNKAEIVDQKIEEFLVNFLKTLNKMSENDFETAKMSLIKLKSLPDTELKEEVSRNWAEVTEDEYLFDRRFREIEALKSITHFKMVKFYKKFIDKQFRRKLSIQVVGDEQVKLDNEDTGDIFEEEQGVSLTYLGASGISNGRALNYIKNIDQFKAQLQTYPLTKTSLD